MGFRDMSGSVALALASVCQLAVALVFLRSSLAKLRDRNRFRRQLAAYELMHPALNGVAALIVVGVQVLVGITLLIGPPGYLVAGSLVAALALVTVFLVAVSVTLDRGLSIECGCFGDFGERVTRRTLLRLIVVVPPVIFAIAINMTMGSQPGLALAAIYANP